MQETCTDIIADLLSKHLEAKGVIVVISAEHGCMFGRGVKVHNTPTSTSTVRGLFRDVPSARQEFFELIRVNHFSGTVS
jgi:GTP cyclohydrolase I